MTTKKELMTLKKDIRDIQKKIDKFIKAIGTEKKSKAPAKKKTTKVTATDQVLKIINRSKKGVDTATLMKKTGFNEKKIRNIVFRTMKQGKIKSAEKGIYVGVETKAPKVSKARAAKAKSSVKAPSKMGATKLTATDQVLEIVNEAKKGVDIISIKEKTGFKDRKVRNIIFRANKEGKIQRAERGIYVGVTQG